MTATAQLVGNIATKAETAPIRVLHVVPQLGVGGTENGVLNILEHLGGEVTQSICAVRSCDMSSPRIAAVRDRVAVIGVQRRSAISMLAEYFRQTRPDVVHSRNWGAIESVIAARLARVPAIIHSEHGYEIGMENGLPFRQRLFRAIAYRAASVVMTVSEELREFHATQAWVSAAKIRVIPNGVDTQKFKPNPAARSAIRRELGIAQDATVITTVGRVIALKNQEAVIRAMRELPGDGSKLVALIIGDGPERARLENLVACEGLGGKVLMLGAREDINDLLGASDVFCLPSHLEGMSNTVLEAMAVGLPVVATRVGANPELVDDNQTGLLVPVRDDRALTAALMRLATNPEMRIRMGSAARGRVLLNFSLELMMKRYLQLYRDCITKKGMPKAA